MKWSRGIMSHKREILKESRSNSNCAYWSTVLEWIYAVTPVRSSHCPYSPVSSYIKTQLIFKASLNPKHFFPLLNHLEIWPSLCRVIYAQFEPRRLFSFSSAEGGKFIRDHLKSQFKECMYCTRLICDITASLELFIVQYATDTSIIWTLRISDFSVK